MSERATSLQSAREQLERACGETQTILRRKLALDDGPLLDALRRGGHRLADVALALLGSPSRAVVADLEAVLGVRVRTCPRAARFDPRPLPADTAPPDRGRSSVDLSLVITSVARNPLLPTSGIFQEYREFRAGRTLEQCVRRGVSRRLVRRALRRGWLETREAGR